MLKIISNKTLYFLFKNKVFIILLTILVIGLGLTLQMERIVENKIKNHFTKTHYLDISIDKISYNIWSNSILISNFNFSSNKKNTTFVTSKIQLKGINILYFFFHKRLIIKNIKIQSANLKKDSSQEPKSLENKIKRNYSLPKLSSIEIENIEIDNLIFNWKNKKEFHSKFHKIKLDNIEFNFKKSIKYLYEKASIEELVFFQKNSNYKLITNQIEFKPQELSFNKLSFIPKDQTIYQVANDYKFANETYNIHLHKGSLRWDEKNIETLIQKKNFNSFTTERGYLHIYKDKTKGQNFNLRPLLPNQKLYSIKHSLNIPFVELRNINLIYEEKLINSKDLLFLSLDKSSFKAYGIRTGNYLKDTENPLKLEIEGVFMEKTIAQLEMSFDLKKNKKLPILIKGKLGKSNLADYNRALYPATGIYFSSGTLDSLIFASEMNEKIGIGSMELLYSNAKVVQRKTKETVVENKLLTLLENFTLKSQNPNKNGKIRVAKIDVHRIPYKAMGNYVWKNIESGIINSLILFGKKANDSLLISSFPK